MSLDFKELEGRPYLPGAMAPNVSSQASNNVVTTPAGMVSRNAMGHPSLSQHVVFAAAAAVAQQPNPIHSIPQQSQAQQQLGLSQTVNSNGTIGLENLMDQSTMQRK